MQTTAWQPDRYQEQVNAHFKASASYWKEVYETPGVLPEICRRRHSTALTWIAQLPPRAVARVLEIGCGAGLLSIALARAGYLVEAIDPEPTMVELAQQHATRDGVDSRLTVTSGDAHGLSFEAERFDLVVALGVMPWLHSEPVALSEMRRVLRPGGYLLLTANNEYGLPRLLDPLSTPLLAPVRWVVKQMLYALGIRKHVTDQLPVKRHSPAEIDRMLEDCGLAKLGSTTLGYGPLTLCGWRCFSEAASIRINRQLQRLADLGIVPLCVIGSQYVVLATKPGEN